MWLQPKDLYKGTNFFPPLSYQKQVKLRKENEIKFIKIGGLVYYKKEWIEQYLESLEHNQDKTSQKNNDNE